MKKRMKKSGLLLLVMLLAASSLVYAAGPGEKIPYPVNLVTFITHSSPGGGSDLFLRELIPFLSKIIDTKFVVKNIKGGGGAPAMAALVNSPADGSIFYATTPTCIQTPMFSKTEYTIKDLEPMVNILLDPMVVYTRKNSQFKSLTDVINYAKANPGKAKWGSGTAMELGRQILEQLVETSGTDARIVSYEGGGELMLSVLGGTLDIGAGEVAEISSQLDAGQIRILAFFTDYRLAKYPDVPTAKEQGVNLSLSKFRGLTGPKGLPVEVVKALEKAIPLLLADPDYKKLYEDNCLVPAFMNQKDFQKYVVVMEKELKDYLVKMQVIK